MYLQVEECVRKLLYCLCTQLSVLSYTIVTYYWQTLTQVQDDTRYNIH